MCPNIFQSIRFYGWIIIKRSHGPSAHYSFGKRSRLVCLWNLSYLDFSSAIFLYLFFSQDLVNVRKELRTLLILISKFWEWWVWIWYLIWMMGCLFFKFITWISIYADLKLWVAHLLFLNWWECLKDFFFKILGLLVMKIFISWSTSGGTLFDSGLTPRETVSFGWRRVLLASVV